MYQSKNKVLSPNELTGQIAAWRIKDEVVVFTNGCFDLIHPGHLDYLERARKLGNRLVIGLNSDHSVTRLKGASRPVMDQGARALHLAAFEFVDAVVLFEEDTPLNLITLVQPDILVKGGDYRPEDIVGAGVVNDRGGKVIVLDFLEGYSTSGLIEKIKRL